ncbi:MAG: TraB/GumN family protein, partial [Verrucomicrobiales bacterium]|nr:TraB/GumN family protein [Verrucomicrobiales bacterium]
MNGTIKAVLGVLGLSLVVLTWQVIGKREAPVGGGSGLVYRVEYGGGTHYVAASFHLLKKSDYPLPIPYATAFEAADELVFELGDEAGRGRDETVEKFFTAGKYVGDQSLKTELPGEVYSKLAAAEKRLGLTAGSLDGYRPWLAALTLATAKHRSLGALSEFGMEGYFESLAREGGKGISGLESVEAQIGLFAGLSEEESAELLDQTLAEVFLSEERTFYLVRAWRRGDANEVDRFLGRG